MAIRYDFVELKAELSPEGWLRDKPVVTRAGIFNYTHADGSVRREYRPAAEVFRVESLSSLLGVPVTDGHAGLVDKDHTSAIIGSVLTAGERRHDDVLAEVVIYDTARLGAKRELSLGYRCDVEDVAGEYQGAAYDAVQKNITYNHLACVKRGRAGNARLRLDREDAASGQFELELEQRKKGMAENKLTTVRVDEIDYEAAPEVARALRRAEDEAGRARAATVELQKRYDGLEAERDTLKVKIGEHAAELDKIRTTAVGAARERLRLEETARTHELKFDDGASDLEIKKLVVSKLRPTFKLDEKSEDYVNSAFDMALDVEASKTRRADEQRHKLDGDGPPPPPTQGADAARLRMIERMKNRELVSPQPPRAANQGR